MGTRKYKCYYCKKIIEDENEIVEKIFGNKGIIRRVHSKCLEFNERETSELNNLILLIKKIYSIDIIPSSFYIRLQDIRNGNDNYNKIKQKKNGYRYKLIEYTYRKVLPDINKSLKNIKGGTNAQMLYGLAIVRNNINDVAKELKEKIIRKKEIERLKNDKVVSDIVKEVEFNNNNNKKKQFDWL